MIEGFSHITLIKIWILLMGVFRTIVNKPFDTTFMENIKIP